MTRQDIITTAQDMLGELQGTAIATNPFAWSRLASTAADEIARATDCYYLTASTDLIANQAQYNAPQLYKIKAVSCYDSSNVRHTLAPTTITNMDQWSSTWRDQVATVQPMVWINLGLNQVILYPVPNYNSLAVSGYGLVFEGYAVPGATWDALTANCPLPDRAHMCVMYKACLLRIIQNPTQENLARRPMIAEEFATEKGKLEAEVRRFTAATMVPSYIDNYAGLRYAGTDGNPLDFG
jgi:hypothetical protein